METNEEKKAYLLQVANTIREQLRGTTKWNVLCSWGITRYGATWIKKGDYECAALVLNVNGLIHKGRVVIAYDEGMDSYSVILMNKDFKAVGEWHDDVMFDELGGLIDSLVERPKGMSDAEYARRLYESY